MEDKKSAVSAEVLASLVKTDGHILAPTGREDLDFRESEALFQREPDTDDHAAYNSGSDPVRLYLHDISRYPLLTSEQEKHLAQWIAHAHAERLRPLDQQRSSVILRGDEAARQLTEANLRLVVDIAKRYRRRTLSLLDVIQEGNLGLMRAVQKFDGTRGYRFSTYATWWIRQAVLRTLAEKDRSIRLPVYVVDMLYQFSQICERLVQDLGREPEVREIAQAMGVDDAKVQLLRSIADPISLHATVNDGHAEAELEDFIPDPQANTSAKAMENLIKEQIHQVLDTLTERERTVLELRYGLLDHKTHTLEEIGKKFHITRERVRQIEQKAIKKLRQPGRSRYLMGALDERNDPFDSAQAES